MTNADLIERFKALGFTVKRDGAATVLTDPKRRVPNVRIHSLTAHASLSMERLLASIEQGRA